jgi:hypothetical protein
MAKIGFFHARAGKAGSTTYGGGGSGDPITRVAVQGGRRGRAVNSDA